MKQKPENNIKNWQQMSDEILKCDQYHDRNSTMESNKNTTTTKTTKINKNSFRK